MTLKKSFPKLQNKRKASDYLWLPEKERAPCLNIAFPAIKEHCTRHHDRQGLDFIKQAKQDIRHATMTFHSTEHQINLCDFI